MDDTEYNPEKNLDQKQAEEAKSFNAKIIFIAIASVLLGAAFVLSLITFGMSAQRKFDNENAAQQQKSKVVSIIPVEYESADFEFGFVVSGTLDENTPTSIELIGGKKGDVYYVINSSDKLKNTLDALELSGKYEIDADFFKSGSVVAVPIDGFGYTIGTDVKSVVRDENYNITINIDQANLMTDEVDASESNDVAIAYTGRLVLVKLPNIQPKQVTVKIVKK